MVNLDAHPYREHWVFWSPTVTRNSTGAVSETVSP